MSDDGHNGNGGMPTATDEEGAHIHVLSQYIKDFSFENPGAPKSLQNPDDNPKLKVEVNVGGRKIGDDIYESQIEFSGRASTKDGVLYNVELVYAGAFHLHNIPEDALHPVLLINCPSILFPFVRRIVGDVTNDGGFPPLLLDPIDFAGLYAENAGKAEIENGKES